MRHVRSFVLSLVLAPLIWLLTGVGLVVPGAAADLDLAPGQARQVGLGALAAAGVLVAVLALARLSPLGPATTGLGFLAAVAYAPSLRPLVPALPGGFDEVLVIPADGYAVVLAVPLLATTLSGRRWRRVRTTPFLTPAPAPPASAAVFQSPAPQSPAPTPVSPPPAPTLVEPYDPWFPWTPQPGPAGSTPPAHGSEPTVAQSATASRPPPSPWSRPPATAVDAETDDLSAALLPLRTSLRPPSG